MTYAGSSQSDVERERARAARARQRQISAAPPPPVFRGAALRAQQIADPAWIIAGPAETGKTWASLWRLDSEARRVPGGQYVLLRKFRSTMDATVLQTWRRVVGVRGGVSVYGGESPRWYDYANGSRVWVFGLDNADKLLSGEFDGICVNQAEELDEADWETIASRATGRGARTETPMLWGDCNPGGEDHWIIRRRDAGTLALLESRHEDNPTLYTDGGELTEQGRRSLSVLDALTGVRYLRLRKGLWVGAEGQYFDQLDERRHILPADVRPGPGWSVWASLDYGFHHPCVFLVFGQEPDAGRVVLLGRVAARKYLIPQLDAAWREELDRLGLSPRDVVVHAGHDIWASRGGDDPETTADKLDARGWTLERATIARVPGWRAVAEALGNPEAGTPETLLFNPSTRETFLALGRLVHDPRNPEDVKKINADAEGRGGDDDGDAVRYGVMARPEIPALPAAGPERTQYRGYRT